MSEMTRGAERKSGNPISAANNGVRLQMEEINAFANGGRADLASFFHDQAVWKNPGEADVRARMNLITELPLEKRSPQLPGQKETEQHQNLFHNCAPSLR